MLMIRIATLRGVAARSPLFAFGSIARGCLIALIACGLATVAHPAPAAELIRIAVALPLSGAQQVLGETVKAAVEMALADHTGKPDAGGPVFELSWHDDGCSVQGGLLAAKAIVANAGARPFAIVGHACPSASQAAAPLYTAAGLLFINAGSLPSRQSSAASHGPRHFTLPGESAPTALIATALAAAGPDARIALVRDRTQLATTALQTVASALHAAGRPVAALETFAGGDKDFSALALRLRSAGITHMAIAAFPSEAALLIAQVRALNPSLIIFATDQLADVAFLEGSAHVSDGIKVASVLDYQSYSGAADIIRRLGSAPPVAIRSAIASYAAMEVAMAAARSDALTSVPEAATLLRSTAFDTILGPIKFDARGSASLPSHVLHTWQNGKLIIAAP